MNTLIKNTLWDVIIIGAGPAGSTCANYLKYYDNNLKVLLIDQHEFPRTKICGDGIGGYTIDILSEFGLFERLKNENKISSRLHVLDVIEFIL